MAVSAAKAAKVGAATGRGIEAGGAAGRAAGSVGNAAKEVASAVGNASKSGVLKELFSVLKPSTVLHDLKEDLAGVKVLTRLTSPAGAPTHAIATAGDALSEGVKGLANPSTAWANVFGLRGQSSSIAKAAPTAAGKVAIAAVTQVKAIDIVLKFGTMSDAVRSLSK
jgi:hypothetical protein